MYQLFLNRLLITEVISTVHISKDFSLRKQSGKNVGGQWGTDSTVYRKYPSLAKNQDGECSLMQQLTHPAHPKGSYRLRTCASVAKREKIRNTGRVDKTNANGKKQTKHRKQYSSTGKISLSGERNFASHKSSSVELFAFVG